MYDVIIIGAGPGGMSAGLYTSRSGLKTLLLEKEWITGGQMNNTEIVDNYLGSATEDAFKLADKMCGQIEDDVDLKMGVNVTDVIYNEGSKTFKVLNSNGEECVGKIVIAATGTKHKSLPVLDGYNGISYCAVCDFPFYEDENVAVIGGGDSALESALLLSEKSKYVYLIHRREKYRAKPHLIKAIKNKNNIIELLDCTVVGGLANDNNNIETLFIDNMFLGEIIDLNIKGVFPEIGSIPNSNFLSNELVEKNNNGEIVSSKNDQLFIVGDVSDAKHKQIAIAVSDGAKAGLDAYDMITRLKN